MTGATQATLAATQARLYHDIALENPAALAQAYLDFFAGR
jgi:hypothetical protein